MNPFTNDDDADKMNLTEALNRAQETYNQEYDMNTETETKKPARRKAAAPTETKATETKPRAKAKAKETEAASETPKRGGPHAIPEGFVGLAALAEELNLSPTALRRKLRSMEDVQKPEGHSWMWKEGSRELTALRKKLAKPE